MEKGRQGEQAKARERDLRDKRQQLATRNPQQHTQHAEMLYAAAFTTT